jgi:branched-chain amino acid transport system permease protein
MLGAAITDLQIVIVATAAVLMAALMWLVTRTRLGRAMRATAENPQVARLMGVNVDASFPSPSSSARRWRRWPA